MREIGSEFWDVSIKKESNGLFPEFIQWFLSGRSALQAIITELSGCHTVSMPSWCCDSMIKPFVDAGLEVHFYPVYWDDGFFQEINEYCDVLLLMDYFGYTTASLDLSGYKGIVIRDVTHSLFSSIYTDANYYFGSLRKWCGIWTGGYAWTRDGHNLPMENGDNFGFTTLRKKAMKLKKNYIQGWGVLDKDYLKAFDEAEATLEHVGISLAADRDIVLAKNLDVEFIQFQRRRNAQVLRRLFPDWLIFPEMTDTDTPMFVPVIVPNGRRNELRHYLIKNDIYCPIHWPVSEYHKLDKRTAYIYENELSLVCDQRYTEDDMSRMVETIQMFMEDA